MSVVYSMCGFIPKDQLLSRVCVCVCGGGGVGGGGGGGGGVKGDV